MPSLSKDDPLYLAEMLEAVEKIDSYLAGFDETAFLSNPLVKDAVALNLLVIGEAANKISAEVRINTPSIPWAALRSLRNKIAHGYSHVDHQLVWDIISTDLADLRGQLNPLKTLSEGE